MPLNSALSIDEHGSISITAEALEGVGEDLYSWMRYSIGKSTDDFVAYVREQWLSGSPVNVITGTTRDHFDGYMIRRRGNKTLKTMKFRIRPGRDIPGRQNYIERWAGTKKEFVMPAFERWGAYRRIETEAKANMDSMIDKRMKKA